MKLSFQFVLRNKQDNSFTIFEMQRQTDQYLYQSMSTGPMHKLILKGYQVTNIVRSLSIRTLILFLKV